MRGQGEIRPAGDRPRGRSSATGRGTGNRADGLGNGAVVFRSLVEAGSTIGERSAVIASELGSNEVIPARTIYLNDAVFGPVEW